MSFMADVYRRGGEKGRKVRRSGRVAAISTQNFRQILAAASHYLTDGSAVLFLASTSAPSSMRSSMISSPSRIRQPPRRRQLPRRRRGWLGDVRPLGAELARSLTPSRVIALNGP